MKRAVMGILGALMILSLAACTPTTEKNKTGEVKETEAEAAKSTEGPGVVTDKPVDEDAPELDIISIYTVSEDGSKLEGTMDGVETKDAQSLVDLLIQYGVLEDGTKAVSFETEGTAASQVTGPGAAEAAALSEYGTLELSQFPEENREMKLQAVANTFIENMDVLYLTISVDGEVLVENADFSDEGK